MIKILLLTKLVHLFAASSSSEITCTGTEPFWGIQINKKENVFELSGKKTPLFSKKTLSFYGQPETVGLSIHFKNAKKEGVSLHFIQAPGCSDGMSDKKYDAFGVVDIGNKTTYFGCCNRITPSKNN